MTLSPKDTLRHYLQDARNGLLSKLDGLDEYDLRRPLVPTGTNLLGLVKHVASTEVGYLGDVFSRPYPEAFPWFAETAEDNADMWAAPEQSPDDIVGLYHRVWAHSDTTIEALELDAVGRVPWWQEEKARITLQQAVVHMIAETNRHAGHADIVRELIDGTVGLRSPGNNMPERDQSWWADYRARLEATARAAGERAESQ
jgi:uncharacterized damage-inducible protein DinB